MQNGDIRMKNVYTVRQVNSYIKNMFAQDFMLNRIYVKGEVSNLKYHTSGHIYFSLKDESGTIACVMFAGSRSGLSFHMEEGQQVVVLGAVSVYERDGKYQLYAREIILDGAGLLYERFEALKKELEEMGMFAAEYKQPVPRYARTIGVVTAPTGAAIRDIINVAKRRNPFVQILLYPALVQGDGAVSSIVKGIHMLEEKQVDVMIVGRGGGSIEDLWAFNEEAVARAIFDCRVPVISAVGHETDTTIADFVADLRAPTPSAAAELVMPDMEAELREIRRSYSNICKEIQNRLQLCYNRVRDIEAAPQLAAARSLPLGLLRELSEKADAARAAMHGKMDAAKGRVAHAAMLCGSLSPYSVLARGYSIARKAGSVLKSSADASEGDRVEVQLAAGRLGCRVETIITEEEL